VHQLILSNGIFHEFQRTSAQVASLGENVGLTTEIVTHPDAAFERLDKGGVDLFTVNALHWPMQGEKYDPYRSDWSYEMAEEGDACLNAYAHRGGKILGLHTASICFTHSRVWPELLGGAWQWGQSHHPAPQTITVLPTEPGTRLMLEAFEVVDELYCDLEVSEDVEVLMTGSDGHTHAQPVVWRRTEGTFKSAYCSMGHDLSALSNPSLSALIIKLMRWLLEEGR
jgi:hypothetical protein